jgi:aquaglyceroporin related protein, other eukaryote
MVSPFFGCLAGGFLYDLFIFTGDSPINLPSFGLNRSQEQKRTELV